MARDRSKPPAEPQKTPFHSPFAGLAEKLGLPATDAATEAPAPAPPPPSKGALPIPARAVLRLEKKGRGGKEVTVVEKLALSPAALADWLKVLKQSLGTGGTVEGDALVLQGDHRERVRAVLSARGVRQISVG